MSEFNPTLEEVLFEAAVAKPSAAERATFLDAVCRDNPALNARLEALLEGHFQAEGFLKGESGRVEAKPAPPPAEDASTFIGRYKLLEKLGEGGFGEVWMAEQKEPVKRRVALKIIKLGMDTKQVVARFEAERQALALMDHPNIAKVLDGGATDTGRPYFVMELVRGERITEFCDKNQVTAPERLNLFIQVCRAIQHAHQKGIIHRDIKPSNILVTLHDGVPVPKIIDFGIAKATQQELTEKTVFTQFRQFLGTPAYISPEQAEMSGLDIDTRSDIYSLGVLLYELLTGLTPFDTQELLKAGLEGLRKAIRENQPLRPSTRLSGMAKDELTTTAKRRGAEAPKLISLVRGDLDWIVMKCLEKDRARRYETANGLARDVERFLHHEPVAARPPSRVYEFQKTVRRHWVGFAAVAAVLVVLALGIVISSLEAVRALNAERLGHRRLYASKMNLAQAAWEQNRIVQVRQLLDETASYPDRGFEWYYWQRQTHLELMALRGHLDWVQSVAFSPDGRRIVTGSSDTTARVWDAASGREILLLEGHRSDVQCLDFSPDGRRIATASRDATAKIWDAESGKSLISFEGHSGQIPCVAFSRDGQRVVTASWDGTAKVWNAINGEALLTLDAHSGPVLCAAFSPDGRRVATGGDDHEVRIWDTVTGNELLRFKAHSGGVWWVAFSPDGQRMVTASDDHRAKVWESATGHEILTLRGHEDMVNTAVFSPDGQRILTASDDHTAKVWDAATGQEVFTIKGHDDKVNSAAFSADGQRIVTGSDDRTAKVWDATGAQEPLTLKGHTDVVLAAAFSPDSQRIATASQDTTAKVWNAASGKALFAMSGHSRAVRSVDFCPQGQLIVTGSGDGTAKVWDAADGKFLFQVKGHSGSVTHVAFSPDGHRIATASSDRSARVWESAHGKPLFTLSGHVGEVSGLAFSPDGRRIVTASADRIARVWDSDNGQALVTLAGHSDSIRAVAFSPDGQRLITGSNDRSARVWDAATGQEQFSLTSHSDEVMGVAFSPDGRRLLTGSKDRTAKVWAASGEELLTLKGHNDRVYCVAFSPDGQRIVTGSADSTAKVWEAATAGQVAAWQREEKAAAVRLAAQAAAERQARDQTVKDLGAVKQWLLLGPISFDGHSGANALAQEQVADEAHLRGRAEQTIQVGANELRWRAVQLQDYLISFRQLYGNPFWSVAYALCYLQSETNQAGLLMKVSSEDLSKVYLNGMEIYRCKKSQKYFPDQDVATVNLKAGTNVLLFKLINEQDEWRGSIRFTDAAGLPVKGISVTLEPQR